ncbi:MAG: aldehyde dehydrogenase family protein [Halobacteriovoraceae bacterium]|nr:aldehyde dehydrogenase family protein [Halobacteriovoraceae bacterium]
MTDQIRSLFEAQKQAFIDQKNLTYEQRRNHLLGLRNLILENEREIIEALEEDLGKSELESTIGETLFTVKEIDHTLKKLKKWMKKKRVGSPLLQFPVRSFIQPHPKGVVLIISPWNYPFQLLMSPLIGALAAGNTAILKPSEIAPATSKIISKLVPKYFSSEVVAVVEGAVSETTALLELPFNHIFYTGNGFVGRIVMEKAAKHLTPVTLELGGKSPCFVWGENDFPLVARRLAWGKFFNTGQTCVAPDYVLISEGDKPALIKCIKETLKEFYPEGSENSPDYGKIISDKHFDRILSYIPKGEVEIGGDHNKEKRYIAPTVLSSDPSSPAMKEEIFGPVLPILTVKSFDEGIKFINSQPSPLASYIFSKDKEVLERFNQSIVSGGMAVNDCLVHLTNTNLPFGGVGESGMGSYHGKMSFDTFTHFKSVMKRGLFLDLPLRYPPYLGKVGLLRRLLDWLG